MEEIIDVEYKALGELESKETEELCREVNLYWNQMEALGRLGMEFAARAGERLLIIKGRLRHGEWEEWCKNNLSFSKSKAEKMMKLANKIGDENSIFFQIRNLYGYWNFKGLGTIVRTGRSRRRSAGKPKSTGYDREGVKRRNPSFAGKE